MKPGCAASVCVAHMGAKSSCRGLHGRGLLGGCSQKWKLLYNWTLLACVASSESLHQPGENECRCVGYGIASLDTEPACSCWRCRSLHGTGATRARWAVLASMAGPGAVVWDLLQNWYAAEVLRQPCWYTENIYSKLELQHRFGGNLWSNHLKIQPRAVPRSSLVFFGPSDSKQRLRIKTSAWIASSLSQNF